MVGPIGSSNIEVDFVAPRPESEGILPKTIDRPTPVTTRGLAPLIVGLPEDDLTGLCVLLITTSLSFEGERTPGEVTPPSPRLVSVSKASTSIVAERPREERENRLLPRPRLEAFAASAGNDGNIKEVVLALVCSEAVKSVETQPGLALSGEGTASLDICWTVASELGSTTGLCRAPVKVWLEGGIMVELPAC
jgi:hypothetical protein